MTPGDAMQLVIDQVVLPSPDEPTLVGFFYQQSDPDPTVPLGTTVHAWEEPSLAFITSEPTYFFWLDHGFDMEWTHPATFVYVGANTGHLTTVAGQAWPVIDGDEIIHFTRDRNASLDLFYNAYPPVDADPWVPPPARTPRVPAGGEPKVECALVVVGRNRDGDLEQLTRQSDMMRVLDWLTASPLGPRLAPSSVRTATGSDFLGATMEDVCEQLDYMEAEGCEKIHFYYLGHGGVREFLDEGVLALRDPDDPDDAYPFTYADLACKLLNTGAEDFCVVIEAYKSGQAISDLDVR